MIFPRVLLLLPIAIAPLAILWASDESKPKLPPAAKRSVAFVDDVQPILIEHCVKCHGPDKSEGGLRLDQKAATFAGGDSGKSIVPRNSAQSKLIQFVAGLDPDLIMPPEGKRLTNQQIGILRAWIDQGAVWPAGASGGSNSHWAYQPIKAHKPPKPRGSTWVANPIDAFVLAKLNEKHILPASRANRRTLIRRLYLDLLGLPPSPDEVEEFVADKSNAAYEKLVDRLLKSSHFGERWGRHWLDKARYADSDGYEKDRPRPNAWRWRDWVIEAINNDMPFDQFTIEQIAGDLLPNAAAMQRLATAFHRQTLTNTEGGTDREQWRVEACFDRVETTGTVWLGLTLVCAKCHSHKYDAIPQREYYQIFGFINNGDETNSNVPISRAATSKYKVAKAKHDKAVKELESKLAERKTALVKSIPQLEKELKSKLEKLANSGIKFHPIEVVSATSANGATLTRQSDGSYLASGKNPETDKYTLIAKFKIDAITGIRIEALADKSLPAGGPGRVAHGNFVLNEFRVSVGTTPIQKKAKALEFLNANADYSQQQWPVAGAIDGKKMSGWAIGSQYNKNHYAIFRFKSPIKVSRETVFRLELDQQYGKQHTIGRFRIMAMTGSEKSDIPKSVRDVLAVAVDKRSSKQHKVLLDYFASLESTTSQLSKQLADLKKKAPKSPVIAARVVTQRKQNPRTTYVLHRGDFLQPQKDLVIRPAGLTVLHPLKLRQKGKRDRLDLANWLVDSRNPLTPRVTVNNVWAHLFGTGLVRTLNDFGVRGERPSHPKLLDWLAYRFANELKWSRKKLIKLIVMSSSYQQSSNHRPELKEIDPNNYLLARQNRIRVEAEIIRDLSLSVSGLLSSKIGGPSVFPPMPPDVAALSYANNFKWTTSKGEDRYRRGMYTFFKRTAPYPNLTTFDCPDANTSSVGRTTSNTPLQALTTLNNTVFVEASQHIAKRLLQMKLPSDAQRLTQAYQLCLGRPPTERERNRINSLLVTSRNWFKQHEDAAKKLIGPHAPAGVPASEAAAWATTARVIMNLDEFFTRG